MTIHRGQQLDENTWLEVCDHEGTLEAIETPDISGERCTECGCAWWRNRHERPWLPDLNWGMPFTRVVSNQDSERVDPTIHPVPDAGTARSDD